MATTKSAKFAHGEKRVSRFRGYLGDGLLQMSGCTVANLTRHGGRQAGTQNKVTTALKDAILASFERLGGASYLEEVGRRDPKTYCALLGKVLPRNPLAPESGAGAVATLSDAEIRQRVAGMLREGLSPAGIETGEVVDAVEVSVRPDAS